MVVEDLRAGRGGAWVGGRECQAAGGFGDGLEALGFCGAVAGC